MSKYDALWKHVSESEGPEVVMTYARIESVLGFPIDHSFLSFKKELLSYGWEVKNISMKEQAVLFGKVENTDD